MDYILFACSIVACIVGVLTFIVGMIGRAKNDGILVQKINQALQGIEELKTELKNRSLAEQSMALTLRSHEEQIKTLFRTTGTSEVITQALLTIMETLKQMNNRGD